jgi:hypothetical protein
MRQFISDGRRSCLRPAPGQGKQQENAQKTKGNDAGSVSFKIDAA